MSRTADPRARRLATYLASVYDGRPWHGPSTVDVLDGISAAAAADHPLPGRHSIVEIVRHMTAWTREVKRRIEGGEPSLPEEGDWPEVREVSEAAWDEARRQLATAQAELVAAVGRLDARVLDRQVGAEPDAPLGTAISVEVMLDGLVWHHVYHSGQIALLRRRRD